MRPAIQASILMAGDLRELQEILDPTDFRDAEYALIVRFHSRQDLVAAMEGAALTALWEWQRDQPQEDQP